MTVKQVAPYLGMTKRAVHALTREGKMQVFMVGRVLHFLREELIRCIGDKINASRKQLLVALADDLARRSP